MDYNIYKKAEKLQSNICTIDKFLGDAPFGLTTDARITKTPKGLFLKWKGSLPQYTTIELSKDTYEFIWKALVQKVKELQKEFDELQCF